MMRSNCRAHKNFINLEWSEKGEERRWWSWKIFLSANFHIPPQGTTLEIRSLLVTFGWIKDFPMTKELQLAELLTNEQLIWWRDKDGWFWNCVNSSRESQQLGSRAKIDDLIVNILHSRLIACMRWIWKLDNEPSARFTSFTSWIWVTTHNYTSTHYSWFRNRFTIFRRFQSSE